jgi:hypothetical protein
MGWTEKIDCMAFGEVDFFEIHPKVVLVVKDRSLKT